MYEHLKNSHPAKEEITDSDKKPDENTP
jgi:hypothetical protein